MPAADALNPRQHKEYIYTRATMEGGYDNDLDEYKLIRRTTNELGDVAHHEVGKMDVERRPARPEHIGHTPSEIGREYDEDWYTGYKSSTPVETSSGKVIGQQGRLFGYKPPLPASHEVHYLAGTREHRAMNMTMLGVAENVARSEGTTLNPSDDLSRHSSRLVGHLKMSGAVPDSASTRVTNSIQFQSPYPAGRQPFFPEDRLHPDEVEAGRNTVRQIIRGDKPRRNKDQGTLF